MNNLEILKNFKEFLNWKNLENFEKEKFILEFEKLVSEKEENYFEKFSEDELKNEFEKFLENNQNVSVWEIKISPESMEKIFWKKWFFESEIFLFLKDLVVIFIIVLIIRLFIAMPFQINGSSMADSYYNKEFIIVDRVSYLFWSPKRWDVIVFKPHVNDNKEYFLKRIIWVPGDKLKIEDWYVYIQKKWADKYVKLEESSYLNSENNWKTYVWIWARSNVFELWDDEYFVIGDNRNHSTDSRECFWNCLKVDEFISKSDMIWKVFVDLWYINLGKLKYVTDTWVDSTPKFFSSKSTHNYKELN